MALERLLRRLGRPASDSSELAEPEEQTPAPTAATPKPKTPAQPVVQLSTSVQLSVPAVDGFDLDEVRREVAAERWTEALDALSAASADAGVPTPVVLRTLSADLRLRAGSAAVDAGGSGRTPWPPAYADPFPQARGSIPECAASELTAEMVNGAVAHHGSIILRGLLDPDQVARSVDVIENARAHQQMVYPTSPAFGPPTTEEQKRLAGEADLRLPAISSDPDESAAWYRPVFAEPVMNNNMNRKMVATQGGVWLGESPTATAHFLDLLRQTGVVDLVSDHFGERPLFSLEKSTLRRSHPIHKLVAWHQDGSFLDPQVRTMNIWIALTHCGGDHPAPGLEIVPHRFDEVLSVDGALTPHSIPEASVDALQEKWPSVIPAFAPGDAIVFDEKLVHRTHVSPAMAEIRYALECWFFAPSHPTGNYVPLLV